MSIRSLHTHLDPIAAREGDAIAEDEITLTPLQVCAVANALRAADELERVRARLRELFDAGDGDPIRSLIGRGDIMVEIPGEQIAALLHTALCMPEDFEGLLPDPEHRGRASASAADELIAAVRRRLEAS